MKTIVFTGGGSGGHIMPNIAIIEQLKNYKIYYLGSNGMEKKILQNYPKVHFIEIPSVKFIRKLTIKNLTIPFKLFHSINKCKQILQDIKPNIIFSKGGYVSLPVAIAGSKLKIPIITHESDYSVGLANKIISKYSQYLCCSFKNTAEKFGKNAIFTGSPIRKKIFLGDKNKVFKKHNINDSKPIILITGGSLGAKAINETIWKCAETLCDKYTIIHIVGNGNLNKNLSNIHNYIQIEFAYNIEDYFQASDIVITRAGSNTIFELLCLCKPMILIPLPKETSRGDQILNAQIFQENQFASILNQENLSTKTLLQKIKEVLKNKHIYYKNLKNASSYNGNNKIIELINNSALN